MTTIEMPVHELPRHGDLGPDPEPFAGRFDALMEIERRARRTPVRLPDHPRRAARSESNRRAMALVGRDAA